MTQPGKAARPMPAGIVRPRLSGLDMMVLMWRAKGLMLAVFAAVFLAGAAGAFLLPQTFTAEARILVSPAGAESLADDPDRGSASLAEAHVRSEAEVLQSPAVAEAAVKQVTLARAWPEIAQACRPDACERLGVDATQSALTVSAVPRSFVIHAQLRHRRAAMSAELLNALVSAYVDYREALADGGKPAAPRELEIAKVEQEIRDFLMANGLTDLAAERAALFDLERDAQARLLRARAQRSQAEAELASYRRQLARTPRELDVSVEDSSQKALLDLRLERQDKLSRYRPDSQVIRDLDARIEQMENFLDSLDAPAGVVRRGPNPLYQQIEASIAELQARVQALGGEIAELSRQLETISARQQRLVELEPALKEMERRRELAARTTFDAGGVDHPSTETSGVAVRVLEPAIAPFEGESLKGMALLLSLILAVLAALGVGLARASAAKGLPTPGAAARTLKLPVLAAVRVR